MAQRRSVHLGRLGRTRWLLVTRASDDEAVHALAGAVIGIAIAAWLGHEGDDCTPYLDRIDRGMALLESGFRLSPGFWPGTCLL